MKVKVTNIDYDTDGERVKGLKKKLILNIPAETDLENEIADIVSDETGFCIFSCDYEIIEEKA